MQSIIRRAEIVDLGSLELDYSLFKEEKEHELILRLAKYPEVVKRAGDTFNPSEITKYLFELSQSLNDYYHQISILKAEEETKKARLVLLEQISQVIENGLGILGIEVVEEM